MNPNVDLYLSEAGKWREETEQLRRILLDCSLTEELKWGKPCYTYENTNIVVIQGFKEYCALLFFKGYMLKDPHDILKKTGKNTRVGRQFRFTSIQEIVENESNIKVYIHEAIEVEKSGLKVELNDNTELNMPDELQHKLDELPALKTAFKALTPGRQRGYIIYFSAPKQSGTRQNRVIKCIDRILNGRGLNDRDRAI